MILRRLFTITAICFFLGACAKEDTQLLACKTHSHNKSDRQLSPSVRTDEVNEIFTKYDCADCHNVNSSLFVEGIRDHKDKLATMPYPENNDAEKLSEDEVSTLQKWAANAVPCENSSNDDEKDNREHFKGDGHNHTH